MNRLQAALKFFTDHVTYIDKDQAKKMAEEGRSLTYKAYLAGYDEDKDKTLFRLENSYHANRKLQRENERLLDIIKYAFNESCYYKTEKERKINRILFEALKEDGK